MAAPSGVRATAFASHARPSAHSASHSLRPLGSGSPWIPSSAVAGGVCRAAGTPVQGCKLVGSRMLAGATVAAATATPCLPPLGLAKVASDLSAAVKIQEPRRCTESTCVAHDVAASEAATLAAVTGLSSEQEHDESAAVGASEQQAHSQTVNGLSSPETSSSDLLLRIAHEVERDTERQREKRDGHQGQRQASLSKRRNAAVGRALTWALRGLQEVEEVAATVAGAERELTPYSVTTCMRLLGQEGHALSALALLHWLRLQQGECASRAGGGDALDEAALAAAPHVGLHAPEVSFDYQPHAWNPGTRLDATDPEGVRASVLAHDLQGSEGQIPVQETFSVHLPSPSTHPAGVATLLEGQPADLRPSVYTYNSALGALKGCGEWEAMEDVLALMLHDGVEPDTVTLNTLLHGYAQQQHDAAAWHTLSRFTDMGVQPDLFTVRTLVPLCRSTRQVERVLDLFRLAKERVASSPKSAPAQTSSWRNMTAAFPMESRDMSGLLLREGEAREAEAVVGERRKGRQGSFGLQRQQAAEVEACLRFACNSRLRQLARQGKRDVGAACRSTLYGASLSDVALEGSGTEGEEDEDEGEEEGDEGEGANECEDEDDDEDDGREVSISFLGVHLKRREVRARGADDDDEDLGPEEDEEEDEGEGDEEEGDGASPSSYSHKGGVGSVSGFATAAVMAMGGSQASAEDVDVAEGGTQKTEKASSGRSQRALRLFAKMQAAGVRPDGSTYNWLLLACCTEGERRQKEIRSLFASMRAKRFFPNVALCNRVIGALGRAKKWWAALEVYEGMRAVGPTPSPATTALIGAHFNLLLTSARKRRLWKWALQLLARMQAAGVAPNARAWRTALLTCAAAGETEAAVGVFQKMVDAGHAADTVAYGGLLSALEKGGCCQQAEEVWAHMRRVGVCANAHAFTTMIAVRGRQGEMGRVVELVEEMRREGVEVDVVANNAVISACALAGQGERAAEWLAWMEAQAETEPKAPHPNAVSYEQAALALLNEGNKDAALQLLCRMRQRGLVCSPAMHDLLLMIP